MGRLDGAAAALAGLTAAARAGELDHVAAVAAVAEVRSLATAIEAAELAAMDAARAAGATWGDVAAVIGAASRQGAQKRRADLARRAPATAITRATGDATVVVLSDGTRNVLPADDVATPPAVPALPEGEGEEAAPDAGKARPRSDEEYSQTLRHHPVAGLGPEWTWGDDEYGGAYASLWWQKTTRAGGARQTFRRPGGWEPLAPSGWTLSGRAPPVAGQGPARRGGRLRVAPPQEHARGPGRPAPRSRGMAAAADPRRQGRAGLAGHRARRRGGRDRPPLLPRGTVVGRQPRRPRRQLLPPDPGHPCRRR